MCMQQQQYRKCCTVLDITCCITYYNKGPDDMCTGHTALLHTRLLTNSYQPSLCQPYLAVAHALVVARICSEHLAQRCLALRLCQPRVAREGARQVLRQHELNTKASWTLHHLGCSGMQHSISSMRGCNLSLH
jgi:hypothetical protein